MNHTQYRLTQFHTNQDRQTCSSSTLKKKITNSTFTDTKVQRSTHCAASSAYDKIISFQFHLNFPSDLEHKSCLKLYYHYITISLIYLSFVKSWYRPKKLSKRQYLIQRNYITLYCRQCMEPTLHYIILFNPIRSMNSIRSIKSRGQHHLVTKILGPGKLIQTVFRLNMFMMFASKVTV